MITTQKNYYQQRLLDNEMIEIKKQLIKFKVIINCFFV